MRRVARAPLLRVVALVALLALMPGCERGRRPPQRGGMQEGGPGAVETVDGGLRIGLVLSPSRG
ncbi:MAG: hypothetical protein M3133_11515, partial [Actinomycetota bacterium]|nr:hypothetical protein [Actinomycetota bacterium]